MVRDASLPILAGRTNTDPDTSMVPASGSMAYNKVFNWFDALGGQCLDAVDLDHLGVCVELAGHLHSLALEGLRAR